MLPFSLLIKPAGPDCNLRCRYCFYLDHMKPGKETRMTDKMLETLVRTYLATEQPVYAFAFQGGEPTLMGTEYFRKLVNLQKKYASPGAQIQNAVQTNGTLITDDMAALFAEYKFLIGVSVDGPADLHDAYRLKKGGGGTHSQVLKGIEILEKHKVEYNVLTLINQLNVKEPLRVYRWLKEQGYHYLQFIPCVEFAEDGTMESWSVDPAEWGEFLNAVFDEWYENDRYSTSVRDFDSILNFLVSGRPSVCTAGKSCRQYFVVEHDGSIYPCDFFVRPELKLGTVGKTTWNSALKNPVYRKFAADKMRFDPLCRECSYLSYCNGDCQKHRKKSSTDLSYLCEGLKSFYAHALPRFRSLSDQIKNAQNHPGRR